jgi:hypothetical protein
MTPEAISIACFTHRVSHFRGILHRQTRDQLLPESPEGLFNELKWCCPTFTFIEGSRGRDLKGRDPELKFGQGFDNNGIGLLHRSSAG